jgi:hypothetical protein
MCPLNLGVIDNEFGPNTVFHKCKDEKAFEDEYAFLSR